MGSGWVHPRMKGQSVGTRGASVAYYSIDQRSKNSCKTTEVRDRGHRSTTASKVQARNGARKRRREISASSKSDDVGITNK